VERGALVLWKVSAQDASLRPTSVVLGNGLTQARTYDPNGEQLKTGMLTTAAGAARLQEGYDYDAIGSVVKRLQYWDQGGFQEDFTYDVLNRVETSTVQGQAQQTFRYDAAGNMLSKTGVGTGDYVYPKQGATAVRPHAVKSIPGLGAFTYDDNGNLKQGAGRTTTWTSFDMPLKITGTGVSAQFVYGPEHQRTRQSRGDGTSVIYAGAQEVERSAGGVTVKTYWPLGIGVEIDRPNTATELNWLHTDRLGSVMGITDGQGVLKEKLAYDAWGKRRTTDGAPVDGTPTPNSIDGKVDNRGFTGHEMLDQLDLVHMNGRVYDPLVARFMSGDPLIQNPMDGQNYNRYSYVLNNPTNNTDPTGFACKNGGEVEGDCPNVPQVEVPGKTTNYGKDIGTFSTRGTVGFSGGMSVVTIIGSFGKAPHREANAKFGGGGSANNDKPLQAAGCGQCNRLPDREDGPSEPEQPGLVEKHVNKNPCLYMRCTPWQEAQAAFTGMHSMVGEAWFKFTATVGSMLPIGGLGPVVVEKGVVPVFSNGMTITQVGENVIGWSKGPKGAMEALSNMTPQRAQEILQIITPAETKAIGEFYRQTEKYLMVNNPAALKATPTPTLRAELAEKILKLGGN